METRKEVQEKLSPKLLALLKEHELDTEENLELISSYPLHDKDICQAFIKLKKADLLSAKYDVLPKNDDDNWWIACDIAHHLIGLDKAGIHDELIRNEVLNPINSEYGLELLEALKQLKEKNIYNFSTVNIVIKHLQHSPRRSSAHQSLVDILILSERNQFLMVATEAFEQNPKGKLYEEKVIKQIHQELKLLDKNNLLQKGTESILKYQYYSSIKDQGAQLAELIIKLNRNNALNQTTLHLLSDFEFEDLKNIVDITISLAKINMFDGDVFAALRANKIAKSLFPNVATFVSSYADVYSTALIFNKKEINTHIYQLKIAVFNLLASNEFNSLSTKSQKKSLLEVLENPMKINEKESKQELVKVERKISGYRENNQFRPTDQTKTERRDNDEKKYEAKP